MPNGTCSVDDCDNPILRRGWCIKHFRRWERTGAIDLAPRPTAEQRFWAKVNKNGECWLWTGATAVGYGVLRIDGKTLYAHRLVHEMCIGPIPAGHEVDHLCYVRACVNPAHLEAVTKQKNISRANARRWSRVKGARHASSE